MKYADKLIKEASEEELLHALIAKSGGLSQGPNKTVYYQPVMEAIICIGNDHSATITLCDDEATVLNEMVS